MRDLLEAAGVRLIEDVHHDLVSGGRVSDDVTQQLRPGVDPKGGVIDRKCVNIKVVVDNHVEAVVGQETDEIQEARIDVGIWKRLVACAAPLEVSGWLQARMASVSITKR